MPRAQLALLARGLRMALRLATFVLPAHGVMSLVLPLVVHVLLLCQGLVVLLGRQRRHQHNVM